MAEPTFRLCSSLRTAAALLTGAFLLTGCGGDTGPSGLDENPGDDPPTNVEKATLTLTVVTGEEGRPTADALGWPEGRVPGAAVTLTRSGSSQPETSTTDAEGRVVFTDLLEGQYAASAVRVLTEAEAASAGTPTNAFGGGLGVLVQAPATERPFLVSAGARGTLVIGEYGQAPGREPDGSGYCCGGFVELYNASDTTIYLDGKTLGQGSFTAVDVPDFFSCEESERYRLDPDGIWSITFYRFPGSGRDHPLAPGASAIVAADAIDHRPIATETLDLSGADFELIGNKDVDNPAVPNMISIGSHIGESTNHGEYILRTGKSVLYVAEFVDPAPLPMEKVTHWQWEVRRIPADRIIDVVSSRIITSPHNEEAFPYCGELVHPSFERQETTVIQPSDPNSLHRRELTRLLDGRPVLQRTFTTAEDFGRRVPAPGVVP